MHQKIYESVERFWQTSMLAALEDFIRIPALSPDFDNSWEKTGHLAFAVEQAKAWAQKQGIRGLKCEIVKDEGCTPCLLVEIEPSSADKFERSVFFYGHLDKQPENEGWDADKSPWVPVLQNGRLYGRGSVDDGYAFYSLLGAVKVMQELGFAHPRCVGLFETCEESSSRHYEAYLDKCRQRLGDIGLVIALDSTCGDYDRLWIVRSLRGMLGGVLKVQTLTEGVHSGEASGIAPSSFMVLRNLLDRLENSATGEMLPQAFKTEISDETVEENRQVAALLGDEVWSHFPFAGATQPLSRDALTCLLNRGWRPEMTVTGIDGVPKVENAGNVMRVFTAAKIGIRLPPGVDAVKASRALSQIVTENPPFQAKVSYSSTVESDGWTAPQTAPWLQKAFEESSQAFLGNAPCYFGMGASIPLLNVFSKTWPKAQFMVAGGLGPNSNAHGPNESLHIEYALKLIASIVWIVANYKE
ncbi:M20/M25/M40 family metallo-hydrolase [uncultured Parasutterella sp.]|uniref:M20/M25/M40 family metallo-hydrolase n=3 Tax=uncultured Parasutterella sp. TaxID=1263098 RepID=UPI0026089B3A|nr:M20/M25/M40 family metallo-hydrolase [uncultured Parasutterella sp.]